jgi:hypothetical protein
MWLVDKKTQLGRSIERWYEFLYRMVRERRSGREAVTVYIIKYIPA